MVDFVKLKKKTPGGGPVPDMWGGLDLDGHGLYNESTHEVLHSSHPLFHPFTPFIAWQLVHFSILSLATTYQQATRIKNIVHGERGPGNETSYGQSSSPLNNKPPAFIYIHQYICTHTANDLPTTFLVVLLQSLFR